MAPSLRCYWKRRTILVFTSTLLGALLLWQYSRTLEIGAGSVFGTRQTHNPELDRLEILFMARYSEMGIERSNVRNSTCKGPTSVYPCFDDTCDAGFAPANQRFRNILESQYPLQEQHLSVIKHMADELDKKTDITFIVGASENHFHETEGVLKDLFQKVLPFLSQHTTYSYQVVFFDLGLSQLRLQMLQKHCNCTVLKFPFHLFPPMFSDLRSYVWKPVIIKALYGVSKFVVWTDASVSFPHSANISAILHHADRWGLYISRNYDTMMPARVARPTLDYFHMPACLLAPFFELATGFLVFKHDELTEKAILDSWVACAFSPDCLCPGKQCRQLYGGCHNTSQRYSRCHRFDQSAIGVLLVTLFDYKATTVMGGRTPFAFNWGQSVQFFPKQL